MKYLKTFEMYDDYIQKDLHNIASIDEEERLRMIDAILSYVETHGNPAIDIEEARFNLMSMPNPILLDVYNQINSNQTSEALEFLNESKENDVEYFQSLIGKKIKCKKDYKYRKNSLTSTFAEAGDVMKIKKVIFDISPKGENYGVRTDYKDIEKKFEKGDKLLHVSFEVTKGAFKSIPAIKSKKQFLTYFEIVK